MAVGIIMTLNPLAQIQKARDASRKSDLSQIQKGLETYYQDNNKYPQSTSDYKIKGLDGSTIEWNSSWLPYMSKVPKDSSSSKKYVYYSTGTDGQTYYIYASLDRGINDPQICQNLNANGECSSVPGANLCLNKCNYGVSSPNVSP